MFLLLFLKVGGTSISLDENVGCALLGGGKFRFIRLLNVGDLSRDWVDEYIGASRLGGAVIGMSCSPSDSPNERGPSS